MKHSLPCLIVTTLLLVAGDGSLSAQPAKPQFEFVSVQRVPSLCGVIELNLKCERQTPPRSTWRVFPGGRIEVTNQLAIDLVRVAYGLERLDARYVSGGPGWMHKERYDIIALTGADGRTGPQRDSLTSQQMRLMLRGLLQDRFKLQVRTVPKNTEVFVISRTDSAPGPALKPSTRECRGRSFEWGLPECARFLNGRIEATDISMAELSDVLSRMTRAPVVDETGIDGHYDVSIDMTRRDDDVSVAVILRRELGLDWRRMKRVLDRVEITGAERPVDD